LDNGSGGVAFTDLEDLFISGDLVFYTEKMLSDSLVLIILTSLYLVQYWLYAMDVVDNDQTLLT